MSWWFIEGAPGERFCWAKDPTYECAHAYFERRKPDDDSPAVRVPSLTQLRVVEQVAAALGTSNDDVMRILERGHAHRGGVRRRVDGRLTELCDGCGAKMRRRGFRAWSERLVAESELSSEQRVSARIGESLGGDGKTWRTVESHYHGTKREAEAWARAGVKASKAAVG